MDLFDRKGIQPMLISEQVAPYDDTDADAIITLQNVSGFVSAEPFVIVSVDMQDEFPYLLVFRCSLCRGRAEVLVVSASVDAKDPA